MDLSWQLLLTVPPILIALTLHEYAHAWVATKCGDPTARLQGRLTLNPLAHLDPIGTLLLFIARFGWAKPVPVDPRNFSHPRRDLVLVAVAGPMINLVLALGFGVMYRILQHQFFMDGWVIAFIESMTAYSVMINLVLAFFNLLPIPPLDGSKILSVILPQTVLPAYQRLERVGPFILLGLIVLGNYFNVAVIWALIGPLVRFFSNLFAGVDLS